MKIRNKMVYEAVDLINGLDLEALVPSPLYAGRDGSGQEHGNPSYQQHRGKPNAHGKLDPLANPRMVGRRSRSKLTRDHLLLLPLSRRRRGRVSFPQRTG